MASKIGEKNERALQLDLRKRIFNLASPCTEKCPLYVSLDEMNQLGTLHKCDYQDKQAMCIKDQNYLATVCEAIVDTIIEHEADAKYRNQYVNTVLPLYAIMAKFARAMEGLGDDIFMDTRGGAKEHPAVAGYAKYAKQVQDAENTIFKAMREDRKESRAAKAVAQKNNEGTVDVTPESDDMRAMFLSSGASSD